MIQRLTEIMMAIGAAVVVGVRVGAGVEVGEVKVPC
jgi:hypothetical protein